MHMATSATNRCSPELRPATRRRVEISEARSVGHGGDAVVAGNGERVDDAVPCRLQRLRRHVRLDAFQPFGKEEAAVRDLLGVGHHEPFHPRKPDGCLLFRR